MSGTLSPKAGWARPSGRGFIRNELMSLYRVEGPRRRRATSHGVMDDRSTPTPPCLSLHPLGPAFGSILDTTTPRDVVGFLRRGAGSRSTGVPQGGGGVDMRR